MEVMKGKKIEKKEYGSGSEEKNEERKRRKKVYESVGVFACILRGEGGGGEGKRERHRWCGSFICPPI